MATETGPPNLTSTVTSIDYFCRDMPSAVIITATFLVPSALLGVPANLRLMWVLVQRQRSGSSNDIYMLNLTIMDLIFNITVIISELNAFIWQSDLMLKIGLVFDWFNVSGRPLFIICICVDCYMAVVYPITYMRMKDSRYRAMVSVLVWIYTIVYGLTTVLTVQLNFPNIVVPYALYIPIIALCDISILCALRKPGPSGRNNVHPLKQKALQTITNSLVIAFTSYFPPLVVLSFSKLLPLNKQELNCYIFLPSLIGPYLGSTIMPLLHLRNLGILKVIKEYFRCG